MLKALAASLGFAYVAHSPVLSGLLLPAAGAVVVAEAVYIIRTLRRTKVRNP